MASEFAPDTAEGWAVLHQLYTINWSSLSSASRDEVHRASLQASQWMGRHETFTPHGQSAAFQILGHKGQFMLVHYADSFDRCAEMEREFLRSELAKYLTLSDSYVSIVELGMYHVTKKVVEGLLAKGLEPHSPEWKSAYEGSMVQHRENLKDRCFGPMPEGRYFCFYPMSKRRGEAVNWYNQGLAKRAELMMEHGMTGRRFAGRVSQIISGSIGFDDWEWGVDLFSNEPLAIKQLVYEMRFDEATSLYGEFGRFYFGLRLPSAQWGAYFGGDPVFVTEDTAPTAPPQDAAVHVTL
jgi:chlorite dismutase